jgi:hypothetical protein
MSRHLAGLAALLVCVAAVAAPVPKAVKAKPPNLDGKWDTAERVTLGNDVSKTQAMVWEVSGTVLTMFDRQQDGTLSAATQPNATVTLAPPDGGAADELDFLFVEGDRRELFKGRAEWDGDELRISFGQAGADRPSEVKATASVYHYRLKRVKDK